MNETSKWYQSKTVWSGVVAILSAALGAFGFIVLPSDQLVIVESLALLGSAIGGIGAIYGRVVATKRIG